MFKICGKRLCSKIVAFDLPQGFNFAVGDDAAGTGIRFLSDDRTVGIEIMFIDDTGLPQSDILQLCKENIYDAVSNVFKVKRGYGESYALFYNDKECCVNYYTECYAFKPNRCGFNKVNIKLWIDSKNGDKYAVKKVLNQPEVKAFFDSIEYL